MSFFQKSELTRYKPPATMIPKCGACGLLDQCQSPKMPVAGDGRKKVLLVGEAPGEKEDQQNKPFVGPAGRRLDWHLKGVGVRLFNDCWVTNSLVCRPPDNETPADLQIDACRPILLKTIQKLNPNVIVLLGRVALNSYLGPLWKDIGGMRSWAGQRIPLQKQNVWVCPTYHPSFIMREDNELLNDWYERHLRNAFDKTEKPWENGTPDYDNQIELVTNTEQAARKLRWMREQGGRISFDYETNCLKPDISLARIVTCSVCWNGQDTIAFPCHGEAIKEMG